jgi:hypothetical protein
MPRIKEYDIDPANADADGLADAMPAATVFNSSSTNFIRSDIPDGLAHQLVATSGGDDTGKSLTIVGTDAVDYPQSETISLGSSAAVETTKYFKTWESLTATAETADTMDLGWVDEVVTKTIMLNRHVDAGATLQFDVTGVISVTSQVSLDRIREVYAGQESLAWANGGTTTSDSIETLAKGAYGYRAKVNSYTDGAEVQVFISEERRD